MVLGLAIESCPASATGGRLPPELELEELDDELEALELDEEELDQRVRTRDVHVVRHEHAPSGGT